MVLGKVSLANLAAIANFPQHCTDRIWTEILSVEELIRELCCHYLVACVYNNYLYKLDNLANSTLLKSTRSAGVELEIDKKDKNGVKV